MATFDFVTEEKLTQIAQTICVVGAQFGVEYNTNTTGFGPKVQRLSYDPQTLLAGEGEEMIDWESPEFKLWLSRPDDGRGHRLHAPSVRSIQPVASDGYGAFKIIIGRISEWTYDELESWAASCGYDSVEEAEWNESTPYGYDLCAVVVEGDLVERFLSKLAPSVWG